MTALHVSSALDLPSRRRVYEALEARPGQTAAEISRVTGLGVAHVVYHLRRLDQCGVVAHRVLRRRRRYFIPGQSVDLQAYEATQTPAAKAVLAAISAGDGLRMGEVSRTTGLSTELVAYHVRHLREAGLVRKLGGRFGGYARASGEENGPRENMGGLGGRCEVERTQAPG